MTRDFAKLAPLPLFTFATGYKKRNTFYMRTNYLGLRYLAASATLLCLSVNIHQTEAKPTREKSQFLVSISKVAVTSDADKPPPTLRSDVRRVLANALKEHPRFLTALPKDAPDPHKQPSEHQKYLKKRGIRAYQVRVEIIRFAEKIIQTETSNRLSVQVQLRLLGVTVPQQSFGFAGTGSATAIIEVRRKVYKRDHDSGLADATSTAIHNALKTSLKKLDDSRRTKKKRRRRK